MIIFDKLKRCVLTFLLVFFFLVSSVSPIVAAITYSYDANGNMTSDGTNCFTYNDANQLSKVKNCTTNQLIAEYVYDYSGNRIVKKVYENDVLKETTYNPDKGYESKKIVGGATENTSYVYANNELVAKKNPDGSKTFYQSDHLGSTSTLTDQSGNLVENTTYLPYGEVNLGGIKSKFGYTGQEKDTETGLNYYGERFYNPHIGRFTQADSVLPNPYDPQQLNRYSYVRNNPLKYTDPSGHVIMIPLAIYLGLTSYSMALASSPDFYTDTAYLSQSFQDYQNNPNFVNGLGVALSAASLAIPTMTFGNSASAAVKNTENLVKSTGESAQTLRKAGEGTGAIVKNTETTFKSYLNLFGTRTTRIPDDVEKVGNQVVYVAESKNVAYQSLTKQIKDYVMYALNNHVPLDLWVRPNGGTKFSRPLQELIDQKVVRVNDLKLKW